MRRLAAARWQQTFTAFALIAAASTTAVAALPGLARAGTPIGTDHAPASSVTMWPPSTGYPERAPGFGHVLPLSVGQARPVFVAPTSRPGPGPGRRPADG